MRAQNVNFERGRDPKEALGLGIISKVTSDDLEILSDIYAEDDGIVSYEEWYEDHGQDYEDDEEAEETYNKLKSIFSVLGNKIKWGEFFDHKEDDELEEYLENPPEGFPYAYNSYPDGDGWGVVWSSIHLPSAESLIY